MHQLILACHRGSRSERGSVNAYGPVRPHSQNASLAVVTPGEWRDGRSWSATGA